MLTLSQLVDVCQKGTESGLPTKSTITYWQNQGFLRHGRQDDGDLTYDYNQALHAMIMSYVYVQMEISASAAARCADICLDTSQDVHHKDGAWLVVGMAKSVDDMTLDIIIGVEYAQKFALESAVSRATFVVWLNPLLKRFNEILAFQ